MSSVNGQESAKDAALVACIDASTPQLLLALGRFDASRPQGSFLGGRARADQDRKNSALLVPLLKSLLQKAGQGFQDLRGIVCGVGPGTFTGTRVAVATAKGLALARNCPTLALDSLRVFYQSGCYHEQIDDPAELSHPQRRETPLSGPGLVLLDARRGEVYAGLYETKRVLMPPQCGELSEILDKVESILGRAPVFAAGSALPFAAAILRKRWPEILIGPSSATGEDLWRSADECLRENSFLSAKNSVHGNLPPAHHLGCADALSVHYLRKSYAEIGANTAKRPRYRSPFA